jgi:hypothetical protein
VLKNLAVTVTFGFFPRRPRKTTRFEDFKVFSVPKGSKLVARCRTSKGKRCKGKLGKVFTKRNARGSFRLKTFDKTYKAGMRLEVIVTNPDFVTQIKITKVRRNAKPVVITRCQKPGAKKRTRC